VDQKNDFVGHIGGDDFVIIFQSSDWEQRCHNILDAFSAMVNRFYDDKHVRGQGITTPDRKGVETFYSLLTMSIGVASPDPERCESHHEVAAIASEAKYKAKTLTGNSLFISRRRGPTILANTLQEQA
jgi:GGDEF domain-containing protein